MPPWIARRTPTSRRWADTALETTFHLSMWLCDCWRTHIPSLLAGQHHSSHVLLLQYTWHDCSQTHSLIYIVITFQHRVVGETVYCLACDVTQSIVWINCIMPDQRGCGDRRGSKMFQKLQNNLLQHMLASQNVVASHPPIWGWRFSVLSDLRPQYPRQWHSPNSPGVIVTIIPIPEELSSSGQRPR